MTSIAIAIANSMVWALCPEQTCQIDLGAPRVITDGFVGVERARQIGALGQQIEQLAMHTGSHRVAFWSRPGVLGITVEPADLPWGRSMFDDFARSTWYDSLQPMEIRYLDDAWKTHRLFEQAGRPPQESNGQSGTR